MLDPKQHAFKMGNNVRWKQQINKIELTTVAKVDMVAALPAAAPAPAEAAAAAEEIADDAEAALDAAFEAALTAIPCKTCVWAADNAPVVAPWLPVAAPNAMNREWD